MPNWEDYNGVIGEERFDGYQQGGWHPVHIGEKYHNNRYEILNRIGAGKFSLVWIAQDHQSESKVILKFLEAKCSENNMELVALQRIQESQHPGRQYLPKLLDHFFVDGPNGRHLCFVLELLAPSTKQVREYLPDLKYEIAFARRISRQMLLALDCLHSLGIVHGDLYSDNILFLIPEGVEHPWQINKLLKFEVSKKVAGQPLEESLPRHMVVPIEHSLDIIEHLVDIQIIDFSASFLVENPPEKSKVAQHVAAPEIIFCQPPGTAMDIWSLAVTMTELVTSNSIFDSWGTGDVRTEIPYIHMTLGKGSGDYLLSSMTKAIQSGKWKDFPSPTSWRVYSNTQLEETIIDNFFCVDFTVNIPRSVIEQDLAILSRCLRKMFEVDPAKRPTAAELLDEEWFQVPEHNYFGQTPKLEVSEAYQHLLSKKDGENF